MINSLWLLITIMLHLSKLVLMLSIQVSRKDDSSHTKSIEDFVDYNARLRIKEDFEKANQQLALSQA